MRYGTILVNFVTIMRARIIMPACGSEWTPCLNAYTYVLRMSVHMYEFVMVAVAMKQYFIQ